MVSELHILLSAKLVLDYHGQDALVHAARRADELLERGGPQGFAVNQRGIGTRDQRAIGTQT